MTPANDSLPIPMDPQARFLMDSEEQSIGKCPQNSKQVSSSYSPTRQ